jgi:CRP-like cAMP-binding protein
VDFVYPDTAFLAGLDHDSVQAVIAAAQVRRLGPNEGLITEGRQANHLFLVKNGNARFYRVTTGARTSRSCGWDLATSSASRRCWLNSPPPI